MISRPTPVAGLLIMVMTNIVTGINGFKANQIPDGVAWCRFKGNLNCEGYEILCNGRGFIDCTGNEDNDEGFQTIVELLTDPLLHKISKMKMKQSSGEKEELIMEKFLNILLNGNKQKSPAAKYPLTEEPITIRNTESFSNNPKKPGIQIKPAVVGGGKLLNLFALDERGKSLMMDKEIYEVLQILADFYGHLDENIVSIEKLILEFKRKYFATFMSGDDRVLSQSKEHEEISLTPEDDVSNISHSFIDRTSEHTKSSDLELNLSNEIFLEKGFNDIQIVTERSNSKGKTNQPDDISGKMKFSFSKTKRSINLWPHETHISRSADYRKKPTDRFRQHQKKYRPYRNKVRVFELQRRLDKIHDALKTYKKTHSVRTGHVTTEVALKILASDILHKLQSTSRRHVRDISSALNSRNPNIFGSIHTGTCRVFNMTCWQLPPLSACTGAGIGGCIAKRFVQASTLPCFFLSTSFSIIGGLGTVLLIMYIVIGIYRRYGAHVYPQKDSRGANLQVNKQNSFLC